jgi:hypothetical protein
MASSSVSPWDQHPGKPEQKTLYPSSVRFILIAGISRLPHKSAQAGKPVLPLILPIRNQQAFFVGANLVFAPSVQGEHKVRPYKKLSFDCELVSGFLASPTAPETIRRGNLKWCPGRTPEP